MACFHHASEHAVLGFDVRGAPTPFAEPGVEPHYAPSRTFRVSHARVRLFLDPDARRYEGESTFTIAPLPTFDGVARFDLADVPVHRVTDGEGRPLPWRREDGAVAVDAGDAREITIAYGGHVPFAGLFFTGPDAAHPGRAAMAWTQCQDEDAHFFMPCLDHPRIKHPWTIELEAPEGYTLLSNGRREGEQVADGRVRAVFVQAEPMPAYLFTAVAARLHVTEATHDGVPLRYLVPVGEEEPVERAFGRTPEMMAIFADYTGVPFPWPRYDQVVVHDFVFGGMENVACTTMTDLLLVDPKVQPHWEPEPLVAHELAHQWFGDLVTCQDWSQAWLNESWATYMETVWWRHRHGEHEAQFYAFQQATHYVEEDAERYRRPIASYLFREPVDVFDRHLYEKGAVVLRTLAHELGEGPFRAGVKRYLEQHAHGSVHGRDFQRALEEATGVVLDRFFAEWIHGAGHPVLKVELGEAKGLVTVTVRQEQEGPETARAFAFSLRVDVVPEQGAPVTVTLPVRERERTWAIPFEGRVAAVRVDPDFTVLAEITLDGPQPWLAALARDSAPVLAVRALRALSARGTPDAVAAVREALATHPFWGVRCEAARLLGAHRADADREALARALADDIDVRVRVEAAKALGAWQDGSTVGILRDALASDPPTWHLLGEILEALGRTRDPSAVDVIRPYLSVSSWGEVVRAKALSGLAHTERADVLDVLLDHTGPAFDDRAVAGAARALGRLAGKVGEERVRRRARERIEELARAGGFRTRLAALAALGELGDPAASGTLEHVHRSAPDGRLRRAAWEALVAVRRGRTSDEALATLRERLDALAEENRKLRDRIDRLERP